MNAEYKNDMRFTTEVDSPGAGTSRGAMKDSLMQDLINLGRVEIRPNGCVRYLDIVWQKCLDGMWHPVMRWA